MRTTISRKEAWELLLKYNKEPFHPRRAETAAGVMKRFAGNSGHAAENNFGEVVGFNFL